MDLAAGLFQRSLDHLDHHQRLMQSLEELDFQRVMSHLLLQQNLFQ